MHVLVTGATGTIGREIARGVVAAGAEVVLACRDGERGAALARELGARATPRVVDLADLASVRALVAWVTAERPRLDVVVANAAVWSRQRRATADGLDLTFGVNHVAHHALVTGLVPVLRASAAPRVVVVASGLHVRGRLVWDDLMQAAGGYNGVRAYAQSKLANVMFALALARRLGRPFAVNAVHPGLVRSPLTREYPEMFRTTPARAVVPAAVAARSILRLAVDPAAARLTGRYFDRDRELAPARAALVVPDQDRLWRVTEDLVARARPT